MIHKVKERPTYKMLEVKKENIPDMLEFFPHWSNIRTINGITDEQQIELLETSSPTYRLWSEPTGEFTAVDGNIIVMLEDMPLLYENMEEFERYFEIV